MVMMFMNKISSKRDLVAVIGPIANEEIKFRLWFGEGDSNDIAVDDTNRSKPSSGLVEVDGWEVEEAANLVLGLEHISPVCTG